MAPLVSIQPWKGLYAAYVIARAIVTLPWLLGRSSLPSTRPAAGWSFKMCMLNEVARQLLKFRSDTRSDDLATVLADHRKAEAEGRFMLAMPPPPADSAEVYAHVLSSSVVKPAPVGGMWYPAPPPPPDPSGTQDEKVVLHFPGGAFVLAYGQEEQGRLVSRVMNRHLGASRTLVAQYRLASGAAPARFPAALQDLATVYRHVLSLGVAPRNVVLSGDSAAGNLVLGLVRYLEEATPDASLPRPGGAIVWSPWVHVTPRAGADYAARVRPYLSPLHRPFRTRVPLFVHAGGAEGFFDGVRDFAGQMAGVAGNRVRFHGTDLAPHDLEIRHMSMNS
ncbi:uncharacterized protein PG998_008563 [Apiospora kogelbergensis]|uniref:uncharacterized protein n=1 Tax=Apiospora kogelbergensis TaxID=1337665 RepID=UPI00312E295A